MNGDSNNVLDPRIGIVITSFKKGSYGVCPMSNTASAPAPAAAPVAAPAPTLADLTTAQLSEKLTKTAERHDVLKASVTEYETVKADLNAVLGELQKRLGTVVQTAPAKKSGSGAPRAPRQKKEGDGKYPSLKEVVQTVLSKNPDGLDLGGIRTEVQAMIDRKEYTSHAKSLSAVISQAINALREEKAINRDDKTKKYSIAAAA